MRVARGEAIVELRTFSIDDLTHDCTKMAEEPFYDRRCQNSIPVERIRFPRGSLRLGQRQGARTAARRVFRRDEVVRLRDQDGLSWRAIAKALCLPVSTVVDAYRCMEIVAQKQGVASAKTNALGSEVVVR